MTRIARIADRLSGSSLYSAEQRALSLTPNFSWVQAGWRVRQPFQRFPPLGPFEPPLWKTAEAVEVPLT